MPELPEVETIVRGLKKEILNLKIEDVWSDSQTMIKKPKQFLSFKKELKGKTVKDVRRRGKNILIDLSDNKVLLVHQKISGHLLYGKWKEENGKWVSELQGDLLTDFWNNFLHFIVYFDNNKQLALSDMRKFSKIELWDRDELDVSKYLQSLGPEPLEKDFTFKKFKEALNKRRSGKIKQILMDQKIIVGIGNIYANEILWRSKVNPFKDLKKLKEEDLKKIYKNTQAILRESIKLKGSSVSDFRQISGKKGEFDKLLNVYRKDGKECPVCKSKIKRDTISQRSTFYCPKCQPL